MDGDPLIRRYDTVLVGADADAPALSGALAPGRARDLLLLLDHDPTRPGGGSALQSADAQILILGARAVPGRRARRGRPRDVRFHGEHIVNVRATGPSRTLNGNGDPSNPGDGLGLIGDDDAHFHASRPSPGPRWRPPTRELSALVALIAGRGSGAARPGR